MLSVESISQLLREFTDLQYVWTIRAILNGGDGSGNFNHDGRPGERGGSGDGEGGTSEGEKKPSSTINLTDEERKTRQDFADKIYAQYRSLPDGADVPLLMDFLKKSSPEERSKFLKANGIYIMSKGMSRKNIAEHILSGMNDWRHINGTIRPSEIKEQEDYYYDK